MCFASKLTMESFLKNLKEQVSCSICFDIFKDPKILPCLHTFCCECLSNHARASHRQGKFHCPECRAQNDLPKGNRFDTLPTSFFHNSLSSVLAVRQIGDGSGITCAHCKKRSSDVHYCFDCARFMCSDCLSAHEVMKAEFEGHKVMPVKVFQVQEYEALLKRKPFCSERYHEREITRYFCLPCHSCICQVCTTTKHRNHEVMLLDEAADSERENIMADVALTREKEKALKDVIRKFGETIYLLETNVATAKRGVSQAAEQMIAKIRESEREAITSLETTRVTRLEKINTAREKAQSLLKQMYQAVEFAQNLVQRSSSSDIMQNKETLKQRFKELRDIAVPKHQESTFIKFTAASVEGLRLGDITSEEADASQYTPKGLDHTVQMEEKERELVVVGEFELKLFQGDELRRPRGIAVNSKGNIAVTDYDGHCIYIFDKEGNFLRKFGCAGKNGREFNRPAGVTYLNDNEILIADSWNNRIQQVDAQTGTSVKSFGKRGEAEGEFYGPNDFCLDEQHRIVVTEFDNHRIQVITLEGETISIFGNRGPEKLSSPTSCIPHKNMFLVSDRNNNCVKVFDQSGTFLYKFGQKGNQDGQFSWPYGMLLDSNNNLLVCDSNNNRVQQFSLDGHFTGKTITRLPDPTGIAKAPDGCILVTSFAAKKVFIL